MTPKDGPMPERQRLELFQAAEVLLEECRMVLPGIQGLFGFQLVAVFSAHFHEQLSHGEQLLHLLAIALIGLAIALIMAPAATHRLTDPCEVSLAFIRLGSRLLLWSMAPLALGLCIDFYLVARVISGSTLLAWSAAGLFAVFAWFWYFLPRRFARRNRRG
jgi:hypothetical protein